MRSAHSVHLPSIKLTSIGIIGDTGISWLVSSREAYQIAGSSAATASDLDLVTSGIHLSTRITPCRMKGDGLVPDDVQAIFDAGRDCVLDRSTFCHNFSLWLAWSVAVHVKLYAKCSEPIRTEAQVEDTPSRPASWILNHTASSPGS